MDPLKQLAEKVQQMRKEQKLYFQTRNKTVLIRSKELEAEVDREVEKILSNQTEMF